VEQVDGKSSMAGRRSDYCPDQLMKHPSIGILASLVLTFTACSNIGEAGLTGPSIHDQLNGQGYVTTKADTSFQRDTTGYELDSLEQEHR
jgi:hypothetical protein